MKNNINPTLEQNLRDYCKTQDSNLFEEKIYNAARYHAASICKKYNISSNEIEETIQDMVAEMSVKLPKCYDEKRGMAKNMMYVLMSQSVIHKFRIDQAMKRDKKRLIYLEDLNDVDIESKISKLIEVEIDELQLQKNILLTNKEFLIEKLENMLHKKIAFHVIACIEDPEKYKTRKGTKTFSIAQKSKASIHIVRRVISKLNLIVREMGPIETLYSHSIEY
jgi:hypothetical protein